MSIIAIDIEIAFEIEKLWEFDFDPDKIIYMRSP
jgi:hypothetical protein